MTGYCSAIGFYPPTVCIEDNFFDDVDLIVVPGGFGDSDSYDNLFKHNRKAVKDFVKRGGKYLGICMGAYWAGHHYLNIIKEYRFYYFFLIARQKSENLISLFLIETLHSFKKNLFG